MIARIRLWRIIKPLLRLLSYSLGGLVLALLLFMLGVDLHFKSYAFKGLKVAGLDIGGLSREDAIEYLRDNLNLEALNSNIVLEFQGNRWQLPLYRIDSYVDLEATVEQALGRANGIPFYRRWLKRFSFQSIDEELPLAVHYDPSKLEDFLREMKASIDRDPVDAAIKLQGNKLIFQRSRHGWKFDIDEARELILQALRSTERVVSLHIEDTPPNVTDDQVGKVIVVDKSRHLLTLYNNMQVEKQYPIACGMPEWPTPSGTFKVIAKMVDPTWVNPGTSWAESMPPYIPPGPGNPLGTRALATSAPGVLIHGTYQSWSIGLSVSHGCIRMYIRDSEDLFPRVPVGTPVLIY